MSHQEFGNSPDWRDEAERTRWLGARIRTLRGQLGVATVGRPYRDRARRQVVQRVRRHALHTERAFRELKRGVETHTPTTGAWPDEAETDACLLRVSEGLLNMANSSALLAGLDAPDRSPVSTDYDAVGEELRLHPDRRLDLVDSVSRRIERTSAVIDVGALDALEERDAGWAEVSLDAVRRAARWSRAIRSRPSSPGPGSAEQEDLRGARLAIDMLEAEVDYLEVMTQGAVLFSLGAGSAT